MYKNNYTFINEFFRVLGYVYVPITTNLLLKTHIRYFLLAVVQLCTNRANRFICYLYICHTTNNNISSDENGVLLQGFPADSTVCCTFPGELSDSPS